MIAVIGGGVAGLVAARTLARQGHGVEVFEAADRLGGMVAPVEVGGVRVDAGAEAYATRSPVVGALCAELGLEVAAPAADPHVWWADRGIQQLGQGIAGIPAAWEDPAWNVLTAEERERAEADRGMAPDAEYATLGELVRARMGEAVLHHLVRPVVTGVYRSEPDAMPAERVAPGLTAALRREGSLVAAVAALRTGASAVEQPVGGMFALVDALERDLLERGVLVHRGRGVTAVRRAVGGWELETAAGTARCETWVSALPRAALAGLLMPLDVAVPAAGVTPSRSVLVAIENPEVAEHPIGSGILLGDSVPGMRARALTHYSAKWSWADGDVQIVRVSWGADEPLEREALIADLRTLLGIQLRSEDVVEIRDVRWSEMPRPLAADDKARVAEISADLGVPIVGAWYAGNGLAAVVAGAQEVRV